MKISNKKFFSFMILALAAYIIKNIFVGVDNDETYGIVLGYRLVLGDKMLLEMWEPHQTSAIFTALCIKPFLWVSGGSVNWLNLYLRFVYFICHGLVAYSVYRTFRFCFPEEEKKGAKWLALVFFVSSPKCIYIPEYSNLHIWFFTLLCLSYVWYCYSESPVYERMGVLFFGGVFLACDVLAYPSMIVLYPVCIVLLWLKHKERFWKAALAFSAPCLVGAFAFIGYVSSYMTWEQIMQVIPYILGDGSHNVSVASKVMAVSLSFGEIFIQLFVGAVIAGAIMVVYHVWCMKKARKGNEVDFSLLVFFMVLSVQQIYFWLAGRFYASYSHVIYLYICLVGIYYYYRMGKRNKVGIYLIVLSFIQYAGIVLMSNWEPIHLMPYLITGVLGGLLYWSDFLTEHFSWGNKVFQRLCAIIVISNIFGYCYLIIGGADNHESIFQVGGYSRDGLRKGIFAEYMSAYCYNMNQEIWSEAVKEGSSVLYIGQNPVFYMQGDCVIATSSTISTPSYDESLLAYWELNPDRYPDVVVFESMWGDISVVKEDSFIMEWIKTEFSFSEVIEYPYITVYR